MEYIIDETLFAVQRGAAWHGVAWRGAVRYIPKKLRFLFCSLCLLLFVYIFFSSFAPFSASSASFPFLYWFCHFARDKVQYRYTCKLSPFFTKYVRSFTAAVRNILAVCCLCMGKGMFAWIPATAAAAATCKDSWQYVSVYEFSEEFHFLFLLTLLILSRSIPLSLCVCVSA